MNNVNIIGRLTKDATIRAAASGTQVVSFSIAVNEWNKGKETTHFFDVVAFGQEKIQDRLVKGELVGVSGRLSQSTWTTQDGSKRSRVEIVANRIDLTGIKPKREPEQVEARIVDAGLYDADIPF